MKTLIRLINVVFTCIVLAACGGGGSSLERSDTGNSPTTPGTGGSQEQLYSITLSLADQSGVATNELSDLQPLTLTASVTNQSGEPAADVLVTFTFDTAGLAIFDNDTGTALTDINGVATIGVIVGELSGDGLIIATAENTDPSNIGFSSVGTVTGQASAVSLTLTSLSGEQSNTLTTNEPLQITAVVTTESGSPVVGELVSFSLDNEQLAIFGNDTATALTDANGIATITISVGQLSGDGLIIATLQNGNSVSIGFSSIGFEDAQATPAIVNLFASSTLLPSSGSDSIELIAEVKNADNVLLSGVEVAFSARESASLEIVDSVTAENGTARALLKTANNQENRQITASVSVGELTDSLVISVIGTEITLSGPTSITIGSETDFTAIIVDSNGSGVPSQSFSVTTEEELPWVDINVVNVQTSATGQADFTISATESGTFILVIESLGFILKREITVQQDDFGFEFSSADPVSVGLNSSDGLTFDVLWLKDGSPFRNGTVNVTSSRGVIDDPIEVTNSQGIATFKIRSSSAGTAVISAFGSTGGEEQVTATDTINFVSEQVSTIFVDASPDIIGPDGQESNISAVVRDANGNVVEGQRVNFNLNDVSGGSITPNFAETDSNGIASVTYVSNAVSSFEAIVINAESQGVTSQTLMTVSNRAFDISLGTGNEIVKVDQSILQKEFAVFVSDSSGGPVEGIELSVSATPVKTSEGGIYVKGTWVPNATEEFWVRNITAVCANEDVNADGILGATEDTNMNGTLTPGNIGAVRFKDDISVTDSSGKVLIEYLYPRDFAGWAEVEIKAFSQSTGTETSASLDYFLAAAVDDINNIDVGMPANPFGSSASCDDDD